MSVIAAFADETALTRALARVREAGFTRLETYTPRPIEDAPSGSVMPAVIFAAMLLGTAGGFLMEVYANVVSYPQDIGGRPDFSWPAFVPIAFEIGALCGIAAGVVGYFIVNRMPSLYEPIDETTAMRRATRDLWCIELRTDEDERARTLLASLGARSVEGVPA